MLKEKQPKVYTILRNSVLRNTLSHAYLFEGQSGVGKKEIALLLAKRFFCNDPQQEKPCDSCLNCKRIMSGNHPDVFIIEPDGATIKVDQVRRLKKEFTYRGVEQDQKVYIIEHADKMNVQAQNALLKFIEEPETGMLFILLTENSNRIINTIRSRCQIISFQPLRRSDVQEKLISAGINKGIATVISHLTNDEKKAITLAEDEWFTESVNKVTYLAEMAAENSMQAFVELPKAWVNHFKEKEQQQIGLKLLLLWQQDLLYTKFGKEDSVAFVDFRVKRVLLSEQSTELLNVKIEAVLEAQKMIRSNTNHQLVIENLIQELGKSAS